MKNKPDFWISCDWGTSNFRLRLVETSTLRIIQSIATEKGIKSFPLGSELQTFVQYLQSKIEDFSQEYQHCPIIISGMASANIGMYELPYAEMPSSLDGSGFVTKNLQDLTGLPILLISGLKSQEGMMRGEEVQALGLIDQFIHNNDGLLILPGTHSKHILFSEGKFTALKTFMTGELFQILTEHSILANTLTKSSFDQKAFLEGMQKGLDHQLTESLFEVRSRSILHQYPKESNYHFLSGLLIGDELKYLPQTTKKIYVAADEPVIGLYKIVLEHLLGSDKCVFFEPIEIEKALLAGQIKIWNHAFGL